MLSSTSSPRKFLLVSVKLNCLCSPGAIPINCASISFGNKPSPIRYMTPSAVRASTCIPHFFVSMVSTAVVSSVTFFANSSSTKRALSATMRAISCSTISSVTSGSGRGSATGSYDERSNRGLRHICTEATNPDFSSNDESRTTGSNVAGRLSRAMSSSAHSLARHERTRSSRSLPKRLRNASFG